MATRFYLPSSGTAPASPAFGAVWGNTSQASRRPMSTSASNTGLTEVETSENVATTIDVLVGQFISEPLTAGAISGTLRVVVGAQESTLSTNAFLEMRAAVVSGDGSTVRGQLGTGVSGTEFSDSFLTRTLQLTLSSVTAQAGDRLVVELGYQANNTSTTSRFQRIYLGDPTSASDFAYTSGLTTVTTERPWVEFSQTLSFQGATTTINGGQALETDTAQAGVAGVLTTNLETNPSFETDVSWTGVNGSTTPVRDNTKARVGSWSLKTMRGSGTGVPIARRSSFSSLLTKGAGTYRVSCRMWVPSAITGNVGFRVTGTGTSAMISDYVPERNQWAEASVVFNWDGSGTALLDITDESITAGAEVWVDAVILTKGAGYAGYHDGDTTDTAANIYSWTGTAHASTSTRLATVAASAISGGQATETSSVLAGALLVGAVLLGGQAAETDEAFAGTTSTAEIIAGGQATETDQALAGSIYAALVIPGGLAEETDEAFAGAAGNITLIYGGQALEVETPLGGTITLGYSAADTTNRAGGRKRGGYAVATWDPPIVTPPTTLVLGEARDRANAYSGVTMSNGTQPTFALDTVTKTRHRTRILVGGKDITYWRGIPTPLPSYQLVSPLLYGPSTLRLPQAAAYVEEPPTWLQPGKPVKVQRVDENGDVVATDYKGVVIALNASGADLTVEIGGEASGRAALVEKQMPLFRQVNDIGVHAYYAIRDLELPFEPRRGPETGIALARFGGTGHLDYISQLCARAWTRSGTQWTIMPKANGAYTMARKDTTTIHATAYLDDARTVGDLRRDIAEEPNRAYATGITPAGQRVRFGAYPGLKQGKAAPYPFHNDRNFGVGTTNAETDTGDGITVMLDRLLVGKYLNPEQRPGGYDANAAAGVRELQDDAGLPVTGTMTPATWRALFDLDATEFSLHGSHIQPAAQKSYTKEWIRSASGAIVRRNPDYQPHRLKVDRAIDLGPGFYIPQMREYARTEIAAAEDNWVGTVTFHTGALIAGDHTPGDPVGGDDLFRARRLQPGMNVSLPLFQGGIVVHVSGVSVGEDGKVTATVDTRARDSMAVWEVIARNRESRRDPARQWVRDHRASGQIKDAIDGWDEVGGLLGANVTVPANTWTVFPVVAGQAGTVQALEVNTNPNAEFALAVFGKRVNPKMLGRRVGNPLDVTAHISSIEVTDGGESYESSPTVDITGGGGSGATAHAVIGDGGKVVRVNVTNGGNGYTSVPSVSFSGGGGSGATAQANRSGTGSERWADPQVAKDMDDRLLLYVAGSAEEPCGYYPRHKQGDHPLTGRWKDDAGFGYYTFDQPVLYVAVYADRDTVIPAGRIMWPQLEAGA